MSFLQAILRHWHPLPPCKSATQSGKHSPSDHGHHVGGVHLGGVHLGSDHLDGVHLPPSDPSSKACPCYQAKTTNPSTDDQSDNHGSPVTIAFLLTQPKFICHSIKCHTHVSLMSHFAFRKWSTWQKHSIGHISLVTPGCHLVGLVCSGGNFSRVLVTILTLFGQSWISRPAQAISIARQFPNLHWFQSQRWNLNLSLNFYSNVHLSLNWNLRAKHVCVEALANVTAS